MAIHIPMRKREEDDQTVAYEFDEEVWGPDPERPGRSAIVRTLVGRLVLDKHSGEIVFLNEVERQEFYGSRVERRLRRAWTAGEYPDEMSYSA